MLMLSKCVNQKENIILSHFEFIIYEHANLFPKSKVTQLFAGDKLGKLYLIQEPRHHLLKKIQKVNELSGKKNLFHTI